MNGLAVYVHIPFCTVKCGYCDFNAYAGMQGLMPAYQMALLREVVGWRPVLQRRPIDTVSFGGGTPGEFPPEYIASVIARLRSIGTIAPGAEVSLEANPGTTSGADLEALRIAGVTRVSFGAQSFDAAELAFLDRIHSPEAIAAAVALARRSGFESVSLDLIYGLPEQGLDSWRRSLDAAVSQQPDHISCYGLTVEPGTPLERRVASGETPAPDPDVSAEMYETAEEFLAAAGYEHYEISNWARPGHRSRHNMTYWTDGPYLGIGAGAHGYLPPWRYENVAHPRAYIERTRAATAPASGLPGPAIASSTTPGVATAMFDWLETALRLTDGFRAASFEARFGTALEKVARESLAACETAGLVERDAARIRLTARGRLLHSEVCARLLVELEEHIPREQARTQVSITGPLS